MPADNDDILGSTARISVDQAAMDALSQRSAEVNSGLGAGSPALDHLATTSGEDYAAVQAQRAYAESLSAADAQAIYSQAAPLPMSGPTYTYADTGADRWQVAAERSQQRDEGYYARQQMAEERERQRRQDRDDAERVRAERLATIREVGQDFTGTQGAFDQKLTETLLEKNLLSPAQQERAMIQEYREKLTPGEGEKSLTQMLTSLDGAYALGYGGMATMSGLASAFSPLVSGQSYAPGQVAEQAGTSILPLIGAIAGTAIGVKAGGAPGGLAGQYMGQQLGQSAEDLIDQYSQGHIFAQEVAGQSLAAGRGGGEAAVNEFVDALRNAATPAAKELATTLQSLGQMGNVAPGAANYFGGLQYGLGTAFTPTVTGATQALFSSPFTVGLGDQFLGGTAGNQDLIGAAMGKAEQGDYSGMKNLLGVAQANNDRNAQNPAYRRDADFVARYDNMSAAQRILQITKDDATLDGGQTAAYQAAKQRLTGETPYLPGQDPTAANKGLYDQGVSLFEAQARTQAGVTGAAAGLGRDTALLQNTLRLGGGAAAIAAALPGAARDAAAGTAAIGDDIARLGDLSARYPGQSAEFGAMAALDRQKQADMAGQVDALRQAGFQASVGEDAARYNLSRLNALYGGQSASQMQGLVSGEAATLRGEAANSLADPAQRAALLAQAQTLQHDNLVEQYAQTGGLDDLRIARAGLGVQSAQLYGGPQDLGPAFGREAGAYADKVADLTRELSRGGLTVDERIGKERELTSARQQQNELASQEATAFYGASGSILGSGAAQAGAAAAVAQMGGGSAAGLTMLGQQAADYGTAAALDRRAADDPRLSAEARARYGADAAGADLSRQRALLASADYAPSAALQTQIARDQGQLDRLGRSFAEPGNLNDARARYFGDIGQEITGLSAQEAALRRQQGGTLTDYQQAEFERQRQGLLTQRADVGEEVDRDFFARLPSLTVGGTSFMGRLLPSQAAAAENLEGRGYGTLAARNFGFRDPHTFAEVQAQSGGLLDAGRSSADILPGNQSVAALADAVRQGFAGATLQIELRMPDGTTQRTSAQVQHTQARTGGVPMPGTSR